MNNSQISGISMGPTDFPPSPSRNHFLVRTKMIESYSYVKNLPYSLEDGAAVKTMVAQRTVSSVQNEKDVVRTVARPV